MTRLEKIKYKVFDMIPGWMYRLYDYILSPTVNYYRLKRLYQRITRGWDDSETWSMDITFFKWVAPRLKRFAELTNGWPNSKEYATFEDWKKDLDYRVKQCYQILEIDEFDFKDHSYLTKETKEYLKKHKITEASTINSFAKGDCVKDFMNWFANHIQTLWW